MALCFAVLCIILITKISAEITDNAKSNNNELVLVTGASGFIAGHIIKQLLQREYNVRGTVRSLRNHQTKYKYLYDFQDQKSPNTLELVEVDLSSDANWHSVINGCDYILSVASPVPNRDKSADITDDEMIETAVNGLERILKAALKHKHKIKRFILTGSVSSSLFVKRHQEMPIRRASNESWSDIESANAYVRAKTLQEKYFWNFVKKHDNPFEAVSINPCMVIGPMLFNNPVSLGTIQALLNGEFPFLPNWQLVFVDVRDVALAHINAMKLDNVNGKRYVIGNYGIWMKDIAMILKEKYEEFGYWIPTSVQYDFVWKVIGLFDEVVGEHVAPLLSKLEMIVDNKGTMKELDISFISMDKSIIDTAESLIAFGYVKEPTNLMYYVAMLLNFGGFGTGIAVFCFFLSCRSGTGKKCKKLKAKEQ